jgi:hypothetical protein
MLRALPLWTCELGNCRAAVIGIYKLPESYTNLYLTTSGPGDVYLLQKHFLVICGRMRPPVQYLCVFIIHIIVHFSGTIFWGVPTCGYLTTTDFFMLLLFPLVTKQYVLNVNIFML